VKEKEVLFLKAQYFSAKCSFVPGASCWKCCCC